MNRYRLTLEYDGRPFMGWQRQHHGPSVQSALEDAVFAITGERTTVHAAGRTDAGVHALAMVAHFDVERDLAPFRMHEALNARLRPAPVAVLACALAPGFHARFDCVRRRYRYHIANRRADLTWQHGLAWRISQPLDTDAMHAAARHLRGRHDFTTFRSMACQAESPVRTLDRLDVVRSGNDIHIHAEARSFLHHQVRSMVGCLKFVGTGQWSEADLVAALAARDRQALALNAPPDGLWFMGADY
ncbi:tRNA pseudouridine synthase A [Polymorphobacter multimanifer]|uniref:tRNA pseudouridine synthase A n=1 Tax=Polymorphobacter multimanifer TaxID=1070431 RepID=A0A841LEM4_9SPHN|nr:tRNA pseudouridine(38-40) synthase TruA [Polymorphobacter multimanifer]MBB6227428.1 tRNA pseudouridine38-40 synthase [Polymorphobacter multimanifer]GGI78993.1 tRNA pseudouridine synthase A [Polymorphobacter multimanifer]